MAIESPRSTHYFLRSQRLGFRCWTEHDSELALALWGNEQVSRFIAARGQLSVTQVEEKLAQEIASARHYGVQYWPIFLLKNNHHVGCCGLRPYQPEQNIYEIGFHIRPVYWRQGFAAEAARTVMAYAFNQLNASALFAGHNPANQASRLLLAKLGFRYTHDEFYPPTGLRHPSYLLTAIEFSN